MSIPFFSTVIAACALGAGSLSAALAQTSTAPGGTLTVVATVPVLAPPPPAAPPPTSAPSTKLGQGEQDISLALAKAELSKLGITHPTSAQLDAALHGGTVRTARGKSVQLTGVLTQRQSGMGWGQIAHAMGLKLGAVVSAAKSGGKHHETEHQASGGKHAKHGKHEGVQTFAHNQSAESAHAGGGNTDGNGGSGGNGGSHGGSKK